ncbi:MAG: hypothetical protein ACRD99_01030 [Nitrososphaera sp.]
MSQIDSTKSIYLIVHGQRQFMETVKDKLAAKFNKENMQPASLEKAGNVGEYVAMIWPPMAPKEIVVSEITGENPAGEGTRGLGAWATVAMKELLRLPLS